MAWTLAMILCIAAYFLVALFSKTFRIFQRKAFVYPSEAVIDQVLPPEIIEAIMTNTDLTTIYSCALVSKYWRHHAEKDSVIKQVVEKEKPLRVNIEELFADLNNCTPHHNIDRSSLRWLTYDEKYYNPQWYMQDRQYVEKRGKKLLDVDMKSVQQIAQVFNDAFEPPNGSAYLYKYVVRSRLTYAFIAHSKYMCYDPVSLQYVMFDGAAFPQEVTDKIGNGVQIECIEDLSNFKQSVIHLSNSANVRFIEHRNFIGGVPIDRTLFALIYLLFAPCIIKDIWTNASPYSKYYINLICTAIMCIAVMVWSLTSVLYYVQMQHGLGRIRAMRYYYIGVSIVSVLALIFYKWMIEVGFHGFLELGCLIYGAFMIGLVTERHPNRNQMLFITFCLVVSIIDWKLTVDAVRSGHFWHSLSYNLMQHIFIAIYAMFISACCKLFSTWAWSWSVLKLNKSDTLYLLSGLIAVLYITCAAPYTTNKIDL